MKNRGCLVSFGAAMVFGTVFGEPALAQDSPQLLQGKAAFTDWRADRPGLRRHIRAADLPPANLAASNSNGVRVDSIAQRASTTSESVLKFLATTHKDIGNPQGMPNPQLLDYQIRQLTAYLLSLRKRP
jgi:hypothetical protein